MDFERDSLGLKVADRRYAEQRRRHVPVLRSFDSFIPPLTRFNDVRQPNDCSCTPPAEMPLCVATRITTALEWAGNIRFCPGVTHTRDCTCRVGSTQCLS